MRRDAMSYPTRVTRRLPAPVGAAYPSLIAAVLTRLLLTLFVVVVVPSRHRRRHSRGLTQTKVFKVFTAVSYVGCCTRNRNTEEEQQQQQQKTIKRNVPISIVRKGGDDA
jgi:hypothetical protein